LFIPHRVRLKYRGRLHRHEGNELEQVVREHVPKRARLVIISGPVLDADVLRYGNLYMVDVPPVPGRLEDRVGKPEEQNILDRLFAEIMVDPVDLSLPKRLQQLLVERLGRGKVRAER